MLRVGSPNFSKGEISEDLIGRVDVATYSAALRRARNVIVMKYGGVTKRPGTRIVAEVYDATHPVRLMPFQFSLTQTYVLEMGQGYMRPAALGGLVIEDKLTIQAVVTGPTTRIQAPYHAYSVGDQVFFQGVTGMVELNGRIARVISVPDASHFVVDVDSRAFSAFTGDTGGTTRTEAPPAPPAPPTVPPPVDPPAPPEVGGGGGSEPYCVADDTLILLTDGSMIAAADLYVGAMLRTRHETTLEWGDYPVSAISFAVEPVLRAEFGAAVLRATADHRVWFSGDWRKMSALGQPDGTARVAKITVAGAHTYLSNGILSHNIKTVPE